MPAANNSGIICNKLSSRNATAPGWKQGTFVLTKNEGYKTNTRLLYQLAIIQTACFCANSTVPCHQNGIPHI